MASAPTRHSAEGVGSWRPDSGSALARPRSCPHERGERPVTARPLGVRAATPAALELRVGDPATGLAQGRDRSPELRAPRCLLKFWNYDGTGLPSSWQPPGGDGLIPQKEESASDSSVGP